MRVRQRVRWVVAAVLVGGLGSVVGVTVGAPEALAATSPATITVSPSSATITVSPSSAPVGLAVTVTGSFGPAGSGCGGPIFSRTPGPVPGGQPIDYVPVSPGQSFQASVVVPSYLAAHVPGSRVTPGTYYFSITCDVTNNPATATTTSVPFTVTSAAVPPGRFVGIAPTPDGKGYWLAQAGGGVYSYGNARFYGSLPGLGITPAEPITGIASDGGGYWLVGADGGVFAFGNATFFGSLPGLGVVPNAPIVGIVATPTDRGYWLVGADGGVFAFGDAPYLGNIFQQYQGGNQPAVALASTVNGRGYYETDDLGGIGAFGDTTNSAGEHFAHIGIGVTPSAFISGMVPDPNGTGVWAVSTDGGVFTAEEPQSPSPGFYGSLPGLGITPAAPIVGIAATPTGNGYWLVGADGGVFAFGGATFCGSAVA